MNIFQIISDILIVLIIALSLILGVKRGFVKSFFKSTKLLLVILVTFIIGSLIVTVCQDLFVDKMFEGKISEKLVSQAAQTEGEFGFEAVEKEIPTIVQNIIPMDDIEKHVSTLSGEKV